MANTTAIKNVIAEALPGAHIYVKDPNNDGQHFQAIVISDSFRGKPLVLQHQMVLKPLKTAFATEVHALTLKTFTPEKWEQEKINYIL